jgi:hypothetical protein
VTQREYSWLNDLPVAVVDAVATGRYLQPDPLIVDDGAASVKG